MQVFVQETIKGLALILFSFFSLASLITHSFDDPGFGVTQSYIEITNIMGFIGAYFSSIMLKIFGYSSFLFAVFFLTHGLYYILKKTKRPFLVNFFIFILSIIFLNICFSLLSLNLSLLEIILSDIIEGVAKKYFESSIVYFSSVFTFGIISIFLLFISFNFQIFNLIIPIRGSFKILKFLTPPLFKIKVSNLGKKNVFLTKKKRYGQKLEPTLVRKTIKENNSILTDNLKQNNLSYKYILPNVSLLKKSNQKKLFSKEAEKLNAGLSKKLESVLAEYGVEGRVVNYKSGPVVTLFEFIPAAGVKTSKIVGLSDDIARAMSSISTRIASQPGKTSVGIEIPNQKREDVLLGDLIDDENFINKDGGLILALGKNISGDKKYTNLEKMPHLLIAGTTGSGKSVGINSMIVSLLYRFAPSECKLILIDPKMLELSIYENIPHLLTPVVTDPNKAVFALKWVVREMENRYRLMSSLNVKNINSFNKKISSAMSLGRKLYREVQTGIDKDTRMPIIEKIEIPLEKMPLIVVVIDEMADLMMVAGKEVESLVQRLAQMARAAGIHLIAATQRPSVDVITGTIKANFPSRISFRVASRFDSRTILNEMGAEQLLGSGDMLFLENGANLIRVHGGFVSENEIENIVDHIKKQSSDGLSKSITIDEQLNKTDVGLNFSDKNVDELYEKAIMIVMEQQKVSTSFIQRYLQIGYNRAARIVEKMEEDGYISEPSHAGKRSVLKKNK